MLLLGISGVDGRTVPAPGVPVPADVVPLERLKPMPVDYSSLGAKLEDLSRGYLKIWVDGMHAEGTS